MEGRTTTVVRIASAKTRKTPEGVLNGGQRWIRTTVHSREQIYSLSPLATRPSTHIKFSIRFIKASDGI